MSKVESVAFITRLGTRRLLALAASPFLILPAGYLMGGTGAGSALVSAALADPLSVFADRSPGPRGAGALAQSKRAYAKHRPSKGGGGRVPSERVLTGVRSHSPQPPATAWQSDFDIPLLVGGNGFDIPGQSGGGSDSSIVFSGPGGTGGGVSISFPGGGGGGGGGGSLPGGGGGTGGGPGGGETPPPPAASAVPEPAAWLTILAGFFTIGSALRSRRRRDGRAAKVVSCS